MEANNNSTSNTDAMNTASCLAAITIERESPEAHTDTSTTTGFLDLPAELRNRIYELALPERLFLDDGHDRLPGILQVSPQIRGEVMGIWLADTEFAAQSFTALRQFLQMIGTTNAGKITKLRYALHFDTRYYASYLVGELNQKVTDTGLSEGTWQMESELVCGGSLEVVQSIAYTRTPKSDCHKSD